MMDYKAARAEHGSAASERHFASLYLDADTPPSAFFRASALSGRPVPPRLFVVPDLVPSRTVTLLYGDGGTGKSLVALQLAHAVATGRRWLGYEVEHGPALFISAEDDEDELHRRLSDVARASGSSLAELESLTLRSLAGEDALLAALDRSTGLLVPSALYAGLDARMSEEGAKLLILDTLADLFPGNENDRGQVRQFIGLLKRLAIRHDCAVVMLAHPSRAGLSSGNGDGGSTGWSNSARSRLYMQRVMQEGGEPNVNARILTSMKANHAAKGIEIAMTWRDGAFIADAPVTGLDRMAATAKAQRVFLKLLRAFTEQGRRVNASSGPNYAPKQFASHPDAEGVTKHAFRQAMEVLLLSGKIRNETSGPASRQATFLTLGE